MTRTKWPWLTAGAFILTLPLSAQPIGQDTAPTKTLSSRTIAENLAKLLEQDFLYPKIGETYAKGLRDAAASGQYDALSEAALAERLTSDLRKIYPDNHLRIVFGDAGPQRVMVPAGSAPAGNMPVRLAPPPAMESARWLTPGIAFVRFNMFPRDPMVTEQAAKFMADYAGAKTIIFDIRTHRGGGIDQMDVMFPWLFDKPTRLVTMATRKSVEKRRGSLISGYSSMKRINANPAFITREHWVTPRPQPALAKAKVYVLTSSVTGSAAEHFALAMKHTKRGVLVGAATGGANHFGGMEDIGGGFRAFIPVGRTYDPVTGKDWEGHGVAPDVDVAAEQALTTVLMREGIADDVAARLSAEVAPSIPMVRRRTGGPTPAS